MAWTVATSVHILSIKRKEGKERRGPYLSEKQNCEAFPRSLSVYRVVLYLGLCSLTPALRCLHSRGLKHSCPQTRCGNKRSP